MIIKLFQPRNRNWLLIAEQLDDPTSWDRFLPSHGADSQRWQFEITAKDTAQDKLKLKLCKELLKKGTSVLEYDWDSDEDEILAHALQVAERLNVELAMDAPTTINAA